MIIRFAVKNELSELPRLFEEIARLGKDNHLSDEVVFDLNLALEEVISNIIRHGYDTQGDRQIHLSIRLEGEEITLQVEDDARPFNPLDHPDPDTRSPIDGGQVGGLGIFLVRQLMGGLAYRREEGRNVLVMKKRIRRSPSETSSPDQDKGRAGL